MLSQDIPWPPPGQAAARAAPMGGYTLPPPTLVPSLEGCRGAVWADDGLCPVGDRVAETMRLAVDALRAAGAVVDEHARPSFDAAHAHRTYLRLLGAATASRMKPDAFAQMLTEADATEAGAENISLEVGANASRALYQNPLGVDELWLSLYEEADLDEAHRGAAFIALEELDRLLPMTSAGAVRREASGTWRFHRFRRGPG